MTTSFTEGYHSSEFLISDGFLPYQKVSVASGQTLAAGAVIGKVSKRQAAAPIPTIVGTGTGLMSALRFGPDVQVGSYLIVLTATGATAAFSVTAPDSNALPAGAVGTAYKSSHLSFLISNGGTMTAGDAYTVIVTAAGTPVIVGTGSGAMSGISLGPLAQRGTYRVTVMSTSSTGALQIDAPDGELLPAGKIGTAYVSQHMNFTVADGGTMTAGDYYNIIVAGYTAPEVKAWSPLAVDGTHEIAGVLTAAVDASSGALPGVAMVRNGRISKALLRFATAVTAAQKVSAYALLAELAIFTE